MRAGRLIERLFASPGLADLCLERIHPTLNTDDEWRAYIRSAAGTPAEPAGWAVTMGRSSILSFACGVSAGCAWRTPR